MKSLYKESGEYEYPECNDFVNEVKEAVEPIIKKWVSEGYSFRELSHEAMKAVFEIELYTAIDILIEEE